MKVLLNSAQLIDHMKAKGITFNNISEDEAKIFIEENNYYMKLASYRFNYDKFINGTKAGKYNSLDFSYLKELSTLDMHLRYLILQMCLDIEHALKVVILRDIETNDEEDGYNIVKLFFNQYPKSMESINMHKSSEYCRDLILKYSPNYPVWVLLELISFGDLVKFYYLYQKTYKNRLEDGDLLYCVRNLRNAAAHSNCLINNLKKGRCKYPQKIYKEVAKINNIGKSLRVSKMSNRTICDFISLLYIYDKFVKSKESKRKRYLEISDLFNNRMLRHKEYFEKNEAIKSAYKFVKIVVDKVTQI